MYKDDTMQQISFNDNWILNGRKVRLPHDAMITEKRSADASDGGHGYFPGGIYTYTKTFVAPMDWAASTIPYGISRSDVST